MHPEPTHPDPDLDTLHRMTQVGMFVAETVAGTIVQAGLADIPRLAAAVDGAFRTVRLAILMRRAIERGDVPAERTSRPAGAPTDAPAADTPDRADRPERPESPERLERPEPAERPETVETLPRGWSRPQLVAQLADSIDAIDDPELADALRAELQACDGAPFADIPDRLLRIVGSGPSRRDTS